MEEVIIDTHQNDQGNVQENEPNNRQDNEHDNICSICLDENRRDNLCITNCNHKFCESCITNWFDQGKDSCPICREKIVRFNLNEKETRLITIPTERNPNTGNVRINNIPVSQVIRSLTNYNLKLKMICYFLVLGGGMLLDFYMNLRFNYLDLNIQYQSCQRNMTHFEALIERLHLNDDTIEKVGIIYDSFNHYKICDIPAFFVHRCFTNL